MKDMDKEKYVQSIQAIAVNMLVNNYAVERVAFGYEKPGDKAPIDLYIRHLRTYIQDMPVDCSDIAGVYIDEQERISTEYDYDIYLHDLYVLTMESLFVADAPKDVELEAKGEEIPFASWLRDYLFGILPLFAEVLQTDVEYNDFDVIPMLPECKAEYPKWKKFIMARLLEPLKSGSNINEYVKDFIHAPHYVDRLIAKRDDNYFLKPIDINSYEFIFALFSIMQFKNGQNVKLLELKMFEWERRHQALNG